MLVSSNLGPNIYSISIDSLECYDRILDESPWFLIGKLFNIKKWDPKLSMEEINMSIAEFWVYVHNLPPNYMTTANVNLIGQQLGKVVSFEESFHEGVMIRPFF